VIVRKFPLHLAG